VECLLPPTVLALGSLSVIATGIAWPFITSRRDATANVAAAVFDLIAQTKHLSLQQCPVCGAQVVGDGIRPQRCRNT
jgi:ATP-dependent Lon protease